METRAIEESVEPSLDFEFLRSEGIAAIEAMASTTWTDYNHHDPGITILEQLCYALTDYSYRADYPLPDLLSEAETVDLLAFLAALEGEALPEALLRAPQRPIRNKD